MTRPPVLPTRLMRPTQRHRLAIAPGILGTVYGVNAAGEARYFDYDHAGAYAFAGVTDDPALDARLSTPPERRQYVLSGATSANPTVRTRCLWVLRTDS